MILWPESSPNAPAQPSGSPALSELLTDFNFATLLLPIASAAVASSPSKVNVMDVADFAAGSSVALSDGVVGCGVAGWPPSSVLGGCAGCAELGARVRFNGVCHLPEPVTRAGWK